jgi:methyl-accepting chemotaxis protein
VVSENEAAFGIDQVHVIEIGVEPHRLAGSGGARGAIHRNSERIQQINRNTGVISSDLDRQNATTNEISLNVADATTDTSKIVAVLAEVDGAAAETHKSAETVLTVSEAVETAASRLRDKVERFLSDVAAA